VPIIAKADTMTLGERDAFRRLVLSELRERNVRLFELCDPSEAGARTGAPPTQAAPKPPTVDSGENTPPAGSGAPSLPPRAVATTQPPPFAVCASEDGTRVYPWGTCLVEDPNHSDLSLLRSMLFASSMLTAKRRTFDLYEQSYASHRRREESAKAAKEARAYERERLLGRAVKLAVATSTIAFAGSNVLQVVAPELAAVLGECLQAALRQPAQGLVDSMRSAAAGVSALFHRISVARLGALPARSG
jgi:septin family protein